MNEKNNASSRDTCLRVGFAAKALLEPSLLSLADAHLLATRHMSLEGVRSSIDLVGLHSGAHGVHETQ